MDIMTKLFEMGVATWMMDIVTPLPVNNAGVGSANFQIGKTLPENVGFIYGLSTYADGIDSLNNPLISTTQAQNIYMNLQNGATVFEQDLRMSDLLNEFAGTPVVRPEKFMQVNIPRFDLSKSFYLNPQLFVNATIRLKIWYVDVNDWNGIKKTFTFAPRSAGNN
jgi:hypothetical protein